MNNGVVTAHTFRYFETGRMKSWEGPHDVMIKTNEAIKVFSVKKEGNYFDPVEING